MPIYELECQACGAVIEMISKSTESLPKTCGENCIQKNKNSHFPEGKGKLQLLISTLSVLRKNPSRKPTDKEIGRAGFTKYVKEEKGRYRKVIGKGPKVLKG